MPKFNIEVRARCEATTTVTVSAANQDEAMEKATDAAMTAEWEWSFPFRHDITNKLIVSQS